MLQTYQEAKKHTIHVKMEKRVWVMKHETFILQAFFVSFEIKKPHGCFVRC